MDTPDTPGQTERAARVQAALQRYWRGNLLLMGALLTLWAVAGLGCGVLWADALNAWKLPGTGYPLGFWFAQQGSIVSFVLLILGYCVGMNRLDARHHAELETMEQAGPAAGSGEARS